MDSSLLTLDGYHLDAPCRRRSSLRLSSASLPYRRGALTPPIGDKLTRRNIDEAHPGPRFFFRPFK
jgi:hypothetical protein